MAVIETYGLTKRYNQFMAVDNLSIQIDAGEIYGFLGLNGAGKTTTIRMLLGMVRSTAGEIRIRDQVIRPGGQGPWGKVGYMVETPYAYPELTVWENIEIFRRLRGLRDQKATSQVIDRLQLGAYQGVKAQQLSMGNAQRLGLAKALLHQPEVLILDEPTNGLDPAGIVEVRELLLELAHQYGTTIFLSSHLLGEIARLSTRIGIIHQGSLIRELSMNALEHWLRKRLCLQFRHLQDPVKVLADLGYQATVTPDGVEVDDVQALAWPDKVVSALVEAGYPPMRLSIEQEDLEAYFLRIIQTASTAS